MNDSIGANILMLGKAYEIAFQNRLKDISPEISFYQVKYITCVAEDLGINIAKISQQFNYTQQATGKVVKNLAELGIFRVTKSQLDRRSLVIEITIKGAILYTKLCDINLDLEKLIKRAMDHSADYHNFANRQQTIIEALNE
ncbi:MAG: hypothetical protein ACR2MX_01645 [Cyclobacteriaceae bacterium]